MSTCEHGYTRFWDCPNCEYPEGLKNSPDIGEVRESEFPEGTANSPEPHPYNPKCAAAGCEVCQAKFEELNS